MPPATTSPPRLGRRALNRATLARQLLLRRAELPIPDAVEHLLGLQAQTAHTWYTGLWSRLAGFRPEDAGTLLEDRRLVRIAVMRSTIHLLTARDCRWLRPLTQQPIERTTNGAFGRHYRDLDLAAVVTAGRELLEAEPLTYAALGRRLAERWPDRDPAALAQAVRAGAPLVQVPPRGVWGKSGQARHTTAESWLGTPMDPDPSPDDLVLRYLAAFGPASVKDAQTWSGLTRLAEVVDRLRPRLTVFRDEDGRELFDLPDAPRPDPDTPAPPRFLYDFDNLLLGHDDRSRVIAPDFHPDELWRQRAIIPSAFLVDGFTAGIWRTSRERGTTTLTVEPLTPLPHHAVDALTEEGTALLSATAPGDRHDIRFVEAGGV